MAFPTVNVIPASTANSITINTLPPAGQAVMANSLPVTIATDQILSVNAVTILSVGSNQIGNVSITSQPPLVLSVGSNQIGNVSITTLPYLLVGIDQTTMGGNNGVVIKNTTGTPLGTNSNPFPVNGTVSLNTIPGLATGANNIGSVNVSSLPSLSTGSNQIGNVSITAHPGLSTGSNQVGNVSVTNLPAIVLSTGANQIGNVSITAMPALSIGGLSTGANQIGNVSITSHPGLSTGANTIGSIGAGTAQIGNVSITAMPALSIGGLSTGANQIGNVSITSMPALSIGALSTGANQIGNVSITAMPALSIGGLSTGSNTIGNVNINTLPALSTGANQIGNVSITSMPSLMLGALSTGSNQIGNVSITSMPALSIGALSTGANTIGSVKITNGTYSGNIDSFGALSIVLTDPTSGNAALITAFHNSDNVAFSNTVYGLMTGGVDQLLNISGNLDRKRSVQGDSQALVGIEATGVMLWNGSSMDRWYGNKTNGALVQITGTGYNASGLTDSNGIFSATGQSTTFTPIAGRMFNISIYGIFSANVRLERYIGNTQWLPLTAGGVQLYTWSANCSEQAQEDQVGMQYRLNCTAYVSGNVYYRISQ